MCCCGDVGLAEDVGKCAEAGAKARYVGGVGAQRMVRGYGYGQVMVRCSGGVGCVMCGRGCEGVGAWVWLRQVMVYCSCGLSA